MNLDVIAQILVDKNVGVVGNVLGTTALPIFKNRMPAAVTRGILLRTPIDGIPVDHNLPGFYKTKLQVIVRSATQADGDAISRAVMTALNTEVRTIYNDADSNPIMQINYLVVDRLPIVYPRDDSSTNEWSINFKICYCMDPI
jgi:hypothetical protein